MRILFIENKLKTPFWDKIAGHFINAGDEVGWLIQNPLLAPANGRHFKIKLPKDRDFNRHISENIPDWILASDRNITHFRGDSRHYNYYYDCITGLISDYSPDIIIGESTLFHELMTIDVAQRSKIPYLHPTTCRYPPGRFSTYAYNTLEPIGGSGEVVTESIALASIGGILNRQVAPDYMKSYSNKEKAALKYRLFKNAAFGVISRLSGEKYNTPSVITKLCLQRNLRQNISEWEACVKKISRESSGIKILYPLQMQPEANMDVWGAPYQEQTVVIDSLAKALPEDGKVFVKPNPKSKYEMSEKLIELVSANDKVIPLSHQEKMSDILEKADAVFSVTGTINLECLFSGKPCFTTKLPLIGEIAPERMVSAPEEAVKHLLKWQSNDHSRKEQAVALYNKLLATSYEGVVGDSVWAPGTGNADNVERVYKGIRHSIANFC